MARKRTKRFSFTGPFRGLRISNFAQKDPSYFSSSTNMETYDGNAKPRAGYTRYSLASGTQPTDPLWSAASIKTTNLLPYDDLLFWTEASSPVLWRRTFTEAGNTGMRFLKVSADPISSGWAFTIASTARKCHYIAGNRLYFVGGGDTVYCYERERIYDASDTDGLEAEGTSDGVTSSTTIRLDTVAGSTSDDTTYTFMVCEIEILTCSGVPAAVGQRRIITAYDHTGGAAERLATVSPAWTNNPDNTATYRIWRTWFRTAGLVAPTSSDFTISESNSTGTWVAGQSVSYRVTYYDTHSGLESNGSNTISITLTGANDTITIGFTNDAAMPTTVYGNAGHAISQTGLVANRLRFYRQIATSGETDWYFVGETTMNAGSSAVSTQLVDTVLTSEASTVPLNHGVPTAGSFGCYHGGRAFISQPNGSGIYYSEPDDATSGLGAEYFYQPAFLLQSVEPITWLQSAGTHMLAFQERRIYRCETSALPADPFVEQVIGAEGTNNGFTLAVASGGELPLRIYYANLKGIYLYDGATSTNISNVLGTFFSESSIDATYFGKASGCYDPAYDRYLLSFRESSNTAVYVYNARNGSWDLWSLASVLAPSFIMGLTTTGRQVMFVGFSTGRLAYWSNPTTSTVVTDDGSSITWACTFVQADIGDITAMKHIHQVSVEWNRGAILTGTISASRDSGSLTSASRVVASFNYAMPLAVGADVRSLVIGVSGATSAYTQGWMTGYTVTYSDRGQRF